MSQSILRNGMSSPIRAAMARSSSTQRSILKRPNSLALSPNPFPFNASFSVMVSPSVKSPHVQFMASPELVATYTTHSSEMYDRAPIRVSPNPLALPARGDRYYSPSMENFKLSAPPKPKAAALKRLNSILLNAQQCASPAITEFEDPRSPKPLVATMQQVRFASFTAPRTPRDLGKSLSFYPRSPYPSASAVGPAEFELEAASPVEEVRGRRYSDSSVKAPVRSKSSEGTAPRVTKKRQPAPFTPIPSPLKQSFKTPLTSAGLQRAHKPTPLALEPQDDAAQAQLSDAFWNAMSLEEETPMVTALEYPESAVEMEEIDLKSPAPVAAAPVLKSPAPGIMFGNQDGSVWSPGVSSKRPAARESLLRSALMSPGKVAFAPKVKRSYIASPSPNDPFASFPSFAAALTMAPSDPAIAYPAPVASSHV